MAGGFPLCFTARSIGGEVPDHIKKVLYFFYRLRSFIEGTGLQGFVVPTASLQLRYDHVTGKKVIGVVESKARGMDARSDDDGGDILGHVFDVANMMRRRANGQVLDEQTPLAPFSVHVGFTGCVFTDAAGQPGKDIYCVAFITPLCNLLFLPYIHTCFLARPSPGCSEFTTKYTDWSEMFFLWRVLLQYEAFSNLRLPCSFGDPMDYRCDKYFLLIVDVVNKANALSRVD